MAGSAADTSASRSGRCPATMTVLRRARKASARPRPMPDPPARDEDRASRQFHVSTFRAIGASEANSPRTLLWHRVRSAGRIGGRQRGLRAFARALGLDR